jgi:sulfatase maturation enzyme AslB (radical SAM superfamily)
VPEVAASGDADMGPANVHVSASNMHTGPASTEVTASKMTTTEVTTTEVTATEVTATEVAAASMSATSMTSASTTSKGHCRDCRTTEKDGGGSYEQCFSQHQDLHHHVLSIKRYRRIFFVIDAIFRTMRDNLRPVQSGN